MIQIIGALCLALLLALGWGGCEHKRANGLEVAMAAQKIEADRQLAEAKAQGLEDSKKAQVDYDAALKTLSDTNRKYAGRLRDAGGSCSSATGTTAGLPDQAATGCDISEKSGNFLRNEADRADVAATYAAQCRAYAVKQFDRQSIRSQVRGTK